MMPDLQALWRRICVKSGLASTQYAAVDCAGLGAIKQAKPEVEFGVSPAGSGAIAPSTRQARTRAAPQPMMNPTLTRANGYSRDYWITLRRRSTGPSPATRRYDVLTKWWADVVKPTHTRLYIGIAFYKVGAPSRNEPDWTVNGGVPELKNSSTSMIHCQTLRAPSCSVKTILTSRRRRKQ